MLVAKGVKKITSKNASHLEPFSHVLITKEQGKELAYVTKVQSAEYFSSLRKNFKGMQMAAYASAWTDTMLKDALPDSSLFRLLMSWLHALSRLSKPPCRMLDAYIMKVFFHLGIAPTLDRCVVSGVPLHDLIEQELRASFSKKAGMYFAGGGIVSPPLPQAKHKISL